MSHKSRTVEPYITIQMCRHSTTFRYLARKPPPLWTWFILSFPATHPNIHLSFYLCSLLNNLLWSDLSEAHVWCTFYCRVLSSFFGIISGGHKFEKLTLAKFQIFVFPLSTLQKKILIPVYSLRIMSNINSGPYFGLCFQSRNTTDSE